MVESSYIKTDNLSIDLDVVTPDFSGFSEKVLSWTLSMSDDINREDHLNVTFTNLPEYNNGSINKEDIIKIKFSGFGLLNLIVKEINYSISNNAAVTQLLLVTRKIYFDTFIPGGWAVKEEGLTINKAVSEIKDKLSRSNPRLMDIKLDIDKSLKWSFKKLIIGGNQNVLDYITEALSPKGAQAKFSWWIDAFNTLFVYPRDRTSGEKSIIDFNVVRDTLSSLSIRSFLAFKEKPVAVAYNLNVPPAENPGGLVYITEVDPQTGVSVGYSYDDYQAKFGKRKARAKSQEKYERSGGAALSEHVPNSYDKLVLHDRNADFSVTGLYWVLPHSVVTFKNFPTGDGDYVVSNITISDTIVGYSTQLSLKRFSSEPIDSKKEPTGSSNKDDKGRAIEKVETKNVGGKSVSTVISE